MITIRSTALIAPLLAALALGPAFAGDIVGKVKYAGTAPAPAKIQVTKDQAVCGKVEHSDETLLVGPDKGVKNVVVNIADPKDDKKYSTGQKPSLDQNGCKFVPHIDIVPASQEADIINSDGILHNIHTFPKSNPPFNKAQPKFKKTMPAVFEKPDIVQIKCDVHSWMSGWIVVAGHAHHPLTPVPGDFKKSGGPAGADPPPEPAQETGERKEQKKGPGTGAGPAPPARPAQ